MPILDIEFVGEIATEDFSRKIAHAAGEIFQSPPGQTWVKVHSIPGHLYAENGGANDALPVFISVLLRKWPRGPEKEEIARKLGEEVEKISGRTRDRVHVLFQPEGAGRVAFGGHLVT